MCLIEVLVIATFFIATFGLSLFILIDNLSTRVWKFTQLRYLFGDYIFFIKAQQQGLLYFESLIFVFVVLVTIMAIAIYSVTLQTAHQSSQTHCKLCHKFNCKDCMIEAKSNDCDSQSMRLMQANAIAKK